MLSQKQLDTIKLLLHDKDCYLALAGIRGPDAGGSLLKHMTTGVVRHLLGADGAYFWAASPADAKMSWSNTKDDSKDRITAAFVGHFRDHILQSLESIGTGEAVEYRDWLVENLPDPPLEQLKKHGDYALSRTRGGGR